MTILDFSYAFKLNSTRVVITFTILRLIMKRGVKMRHDLCTSIITQRLTKPQKQRFFFTDKGRKKKGKTQSFYFSSHQKLQPHYHLPYLYATIFLCAVTNFKHRIHRIVCVGLRKREGKRVCMLSVYEFYWRWEIK